MFVLNGGVFSNCRKLDLFISPQVFAEPDQDVVRQRSVFFSLMFAAIGAVSFVTMFLQVCKHTHAVDGRGFVVNLVNSVISC